MVTNFVSATGNNNTSQQTIIFKNGDSSSEVLEFKKKLAKLGFVVSNNSNNDFGPKTEQVVKEFQKYFGLPVTGIVDQATYDKLETNIKSPYQVGKSSAKIKELKLKLASIGFPVSNNPNNDYGLKTAETVKRFQAHYRLKVNGIIDEVTLAKIEEIYNSPIKIGESSPRVYELKKNLAKLGFVVSNNPNNDFGPKTVQVVKEFQKYYGLSVTGVADQATLQTLEKNVNSPYQVGKSNKEIKEIKLKLAELGFKVSDNPNNDYGPKTAQTVIRFQSRYGLKANGIVDEVTLKKINELIHSPLQLGVSNPRVYELKVNLAKLGFVVSNNPNNDFGPKTKKVVEEFQKYFGLKVTGIADEATLKKLEKNINSPYQMGKSSPEIKQIKLKLANLGFPVSDNPNNDYGPKTAQTVKEFQKATGLRVNGIIDEVTLNKIETLHDSTLRLGMSSPKVLELKLNLAKLGFPVSSNPNNDFGPQTEKVVREFQRYYGLHVSGIADFETLAKIDALLNHPFSDGNSSPEIRELKLKLARLGFPVSNNPNNDYGPKTIETVKEFQSYYGLRVNGIIDDPTLEKINSILSSPYRVGQSSPKVYDLKIDLAKLGYFVSKRDPNNDYGPKTEATVKDFQKDYGLRVNGIVDEVTLAKIREELNKGIVKIFLDPGHGGHDPGATAFNLQEKDIVLEIALATKEVLETRYKNVEVKLSREKDEYVALPDRSKMANEWHANFFYSFHLNSHTGSSANGFETYIYSGDVWQINKRYQSEIHKYLVDKIKIRDRGEKRANFNVLRNTNMPSILVEYMFISNPVENSKLKNSSYRYWLGEITAEAIAIALNLQE